MDMPMPPKRPQVEIRSEKPSYLEQALGAMDREMKVKGLSMKHGMRPLKETPKPTYSGGMRGTY